MTETRRERQVSDGQKLRQRAMQVACKAHEGQRYGDLPYRFHLQEVVSSLPESASDEIVAAAWLHDAVEDTDLTLDEVRDTFGGHVARIVDFVTDSPGENRRERKRKTNERLMRAPVEARTVKLADRIANMKASIENPGLAKMYRREFPDFIRAAGFDRENAELVQRLLFIYLDSCSAYEGS